MISSAAARMATPSSSIRHVGRFSFSPVHRAAVALEWLDRLSPGFAQSKPGAAGLGVPDPPV